MPQVYPLTHEPNGSGTGALKTRAADAPATPCRPSMTASQSMAHRAIKPGVSPTDRTHSREDTLSERDFERLVAATHDLDDPYDLQCRFVVLLAGTLGMRAGEIAHVHESWVNWSANTIEVPAFDPCTKGVRDGEVCGYCRTRAAHHVDATNLSIEDAEAAVREQHDGVDLDDDTVAELAAQLREAHNITLGDALAERWQPKTPNAVRSIPFDFDVRVQLTIEAFFDRYDGWPRSKCTLNRRVDRAAEAAGLEERVYPHALRATAASLHASRGVSAYALMSVMGWSDISTARAYINASDETAAKEIRSAHR